MEIKIIARLAEIMSLHKLSELDIKEENLSIRLCRAETPIAGTFIPASFETAPAQASALAQAALAPAAPVVDAKIVTINAPMPGTFYSSPSPEAEAFVKEGDAVHSNNVICIVEAMKVMNEVKAEVNGIVTKVLVRNASPVEFGQPLFEVKID